MKILGVTLSSDLTFEEHLNKILSKATSSMYALGTLKSHGLTGSALNVITKATSGPSDVRRAGMVGLYFAIIGPSLWNQLLPSTRSTSLAGEPSASFCSLKTALFYLGLSHWKRF